MLGVPFPRHQRTPNVSISEVNLVRETEVNFIITPSMEVSSVYVCICSSVRYQLLELLNYQILS